VRLTLLIPFKSLDNAIIIIFFDNTVQLALRVRFLAFNLAVFIKFPNHTVNDILIKKDFFFDRSGSIVFAENTILFAPGIRAAPKQRPLMIIIFIITVGLPVLICHQRLQLLVGVIFLQFPVNQVILIVPLHLKHLVFFVKNPERPVFHAVLICDFRFHRPGGIKFLVKAVLDVFPGRGIQSRLIHGKILNKLRPRRTGRFRGIIRQPGTHNNHQK